MVDPKSGEGSSVTGGLGIGEIVTFAKDALAPVGGTLGDVWQGLLGDRVAAWRLKNAMATQKAVFEEASKAGLTINASKVPERYAFSWFEEATKQDEPEIQTLFARLLVKASEGDKDALDRRHVATLSQFTPIDAVVFAALFEPENESRNRPMFAPQLPRWEHEATVKRLAQVHGEHAGTSVEHLVNLGVLARGFQLKATPSRNDLRGLGSRAISMIDVKNEVIATALGWSLHIALKEA